MIFNSYSLNTFLNNSKKLFTSVFIIKKSLLNTFFSYVISFQLVFLQASKV